MTTDSAVTPDITVASPQPAQMQVPASVSDGSLQGGAVWYTLDVDTTLTQLQVDAATGLSQAVASSRLGQFGLNELVEQPLKSPFIILREQLTNPLVLLLFGAAVVSAFLGKVVELIAILGIVILNAALGVVQEYRAEKAMAALKKMAAPLVRVRRDGRTSDIASKELVPGDIILLEAGTIIPADARLVEVANLRVQEASLTGESEPVDKTIAAISDAGATLGDRINMVFLGTSVTYGRGVAVVVKTGMRTQLGHVATLIQSVETEKTPLQRRISELGNVLLWVALVVMAISVGVGFLNSMALQDVLLNAVAIAVAVVPEGLPAVITVALALGAQRMLARNALIRKLPAVETLGSVQVICTDKTGTLTENRMTVTAIDVADVTVPLDEVVDRRQVSLRQLKGAQTDSSMDAQTLVVLGSVLCTDALLEEDGTGYRAIGDPTETALALAGVRLGLLKPELDAAFPRTGEMPFDSTRKRMTTVHQLTGDVSASHQDDEAAALTARLRALLNITPQQRIVFTKGAVDAVLQVSSPCADER